MTSGVATTCKQAGRFFQKDCCEALVRPVARGVVDETAGKSDINNPTPARMSTRKRSKRARKMEEKGNRNRECLSASLSVSDCVAMRWCRDV
jgi:hypothetical protein